MKADNNYELRLQVSWWHLLKRNWMTTTMDWFAWARLFFFGRSCMPLAFLGARVAHLRTFEIVPWAIVLRKALPWTIATAPCAWIVRVPPFIIVSALRLRTAAPAGASKR